MKYTVFHMELKHCDISEAGWALATLKEYQNLPLEHPDKFVFAAALASFTAKNMGGALHTYTDDDSTPFTLLVSEWTEHNPPSAVLIYRSIPDWAAAVSFWCIANHNMLRDKERSNMSEDLDCFIIQSTYGIWKRTPIGSPARWGLAAQIYYNSGLDDKRGAWDDDADYESWKNGVANLMPKLLDVLGYDSVQQIDFGVTEKYSELLLIGHLNLVFPNASTDYNTLLHRAYYYIAKPLPTHIPIEVLRNRGDLSPAQALTWYLVEQEYGPKLTYATAANMLGMKNRQEIGTHLKRARDTIQKSGQESKLSGIVQYEYLSEEAPEAFEISIISQEAKRQTSN